MNTQQKIKGIEYYKKTLHLCSVFCYDFTTIINFSTGDGTSEAHYINSPIGGVRPQDGREVNTTQLCHAEHTIVCVTIQVNQDVRHSRIPICIQRSAESLRNLDAHARYHSLSMTQFFILGYCHSERSVGIQVYQCSLTLLFIFVGFAEC